MKIEALLVACLLAAACGGKSTPDSHPFVPPDPPDEAPDPPHASTHERAAPPAPKIWHAKAELAAVKGAKLKPSTVTFSQIDGQPTQVSGEVEGLKAGTYHLVIHTGADCGKNASEAGAVWETTADTDVEVTVAKKQPGSIDQAVQVVLDGDDSIVGHTLVLHADKKGAAGKPVACGSIVSDDETDDASGEPE